MTWMVIIIYMLTFKWSDSIFTMEVKTSILLICNFFFFSFLRRGWSPYEEHHFSLSREQLPLIFLLDKIWKCFSSQPWIVELLVPEGIAHGSQSNNVSDAVKLAPSQHGSCPFKTKFFSSDLQIFFLIKKREQAFIGIKFCINPSYIAIHDLTDCRILNNLYHFNK